MLFDIYPDIVILGTAVLGEGIQLLLQGYEVLIRLDAHILQMQEHRVQGKAGDGVVRIGIIHGAILGGIIKRQQLEETLACPGCPVYHLEEVIELAHSEVILRAQGKDGDSCAGAFPAGDVAPGILHRYGSIAKGGMHPPLVSDRQAVAPEFIKILDAIGIGKKFLVGNLHRPFSFSGVGHGPLAGSAA